MPFKLETWNNGTRQERELTAKSDTIQVGVFTDQLNPNISLEHWDFAKIPPLFNGSKVKTRERYAIRGQLRTGSENIGIYPVNKDSKVSAVDVKQDDITFRKLEVVVYEGNQLIYGKISYTGNK